MGIGRKRATEDHTHRSLRSGPWALGRDDNLVVVGKKGNVFPPPQWIFNRYQTTLAPTALMTFSNRSSNCCRNGEWNGDILSPDRSARNPASFSVIR